MGLLTIQLHKVSGLRSIDLALRQNQHNQETLLRDRRILMASTTQAMNTQPKSAQTKNSFDPNQSSKRRVRRGSDPIHNRS